jgi:hypothetical protein
LILALAWLDVQDEETIHFVKPGRNICDVLLASDPVYDEKQVVVLPY